MTPDKISLDALRIDRSDAASARSYGRVWIFLFLVLAAGGGWYAWQQRPVPIPVRTVVAVSPAQAETAAAKISSSSLLDGSGYVTARLQSTVSAKVTGKVVEVLVEEGMKVEQGQVLARLDATNIEAGLNLAQARLASARQLIEETKPNVLFAEQELERFRNLVNSKATSASDLNRAQAEATALKARLERLKADVVVAEREVAQWQQQMDDMIIRAPFAGVITSKDAQPGEMISPMSAGGGFTRTGICTLVDMTSLEIEVDVNESYINKVREDQPVLARLDAYPDEKLPARVIAIIPTADRQKATVRVRVGFDKPDPRILPEMGVKVSFQAPAESPAKAAPSAAQEPPKAKAAVPEAAVQEVEGRSIVWVVDAGRVKRRAVGVAGRKSGDVLLDAGLTPGERVVVKTERPLSDGALIEELNP